MFPFHTSPSPPPKKKKQHQETFGFLVFPGGYKIRTLVTNLLTILKRLVNNFKSSAFENEKSLQISYLIDIITWDEVFKDGPSKIYGRQALKKFYLVHS